MRIKIESSVPEDKLRECAFDEEKKQALAKEIANKLLRDIEFELYMDVIDGGQT